VSVIENAFVLAATRRLMRPTDAQPLNTIRSLAYLLAVIEDASGTFRTVRVLEQNVVYTGEPPLSAPARS
jgi:hypothetical protein